MKVLGFLMVVVLIAIVVAVIVKLDTLYHTMYTRLEVLCVDSGFEGLVVGERGVYYCYRGEERVLVKVVQYYREGVANGKR